MRSAQSCSPHSATSDECHCSTDCGCCLLYCTVYSLHHAHVKRAFAPLISAHSVGQTLLEAPFPTPCPPFAAHSHNVTVCPAECPVHLEPCGMWAPKTFELLGSILTFIFTPRSHGALFYCVSFPSHSLSFTPRSHEKCIARPMAPSACFCW